MGKLTLLLIIIFTELTATDVTHQAMFKKECISCHATQQIPNDLIYRRYLMVYSTHRRMEKAIFNYIKSPDKKNSVMHHPFFFKFPMKEKLDLEDDVLKKMIKEYLITFDVKNKFIDSE